MADDQKTEQPTARRLEKARTDGNFPVSNELLAAALLCTALAFWGSFGSNAWGAWEQLLQRSIRLAFRTGVPAPDLVYEALGAGWPVLLWLLGGSLVLAAVAVATQLSQTGFRLSASKLQPDLARLNPLTRLAHLPQQNRQQLVRALLLLPVVAWLVHSVVRESWGQMLNLAAMPYHDGMAQGVQLARRALWQSVIVLGVIALVDVVQRRRRFFDDLKMSRQDIKDEAKESDGNPQAKAQIRRMMREFSRRRMMSAVPKATAVIVNPTHFAVAIHYVPGESAAPKVVAKGSDYLAARIRETALKNGVPIVENPPLARALYRAAEVGQEIPAALYRAVAEVLAYVYRMANAGYRPGPVSPGGGGNG